MIVYQPAPVSPSADAIRERSRTVKTMIEFQKETETDKEEAKISFTVEHDVTDLVKLQEPMFILTFHQSKEAASKTSYLAPRVSPCR